MSQSYNPDMLPSEHDYIYPQAVVLIVLSVFVALINIGPFFWHLKARNIPATCLVFWVIILNVFSFVNASIWHNDNTDTWWSGHVYCDIESKVFLAANVGTCGAVLCIMRNLAMVLDTKNTALSASDTQKMVNKIIMIVFCFVFPVYIMVAHYFISPTRYLLYGIAGCVPVVDASWPTDVLVMMWPLILTAIDAGYAALIIFRMQRYRSEFSSLLACSSTTKSRFIRLFANTLIFILIFLPLQIYSFVTLHRGGYLHSYSFANIHGPLWGYIFRLPSSGVVPIDHWVYIAMAALVFAFFGTGSDAMGMYRGWLAKVGIMKPGTQGSKKSSFFGSRWSTLDRAKLLFSKSSGTESKGAGLGSFDETSLSSAAVMQASPAVQQSRRTPGTASDLDDIDDDFVASKESGAGARAGHDMV